MKNALLMVAVSLLLAACGGGKTDPPAPVDPPPPPPPPASFTVGGTVSGMTGAGLVLQNNAGDDLPLAANGAFAFTGRLAGGANYAVTVRTQPASPDQVCTVASGAGAIAAANVSDIAVSCTTPPPARFTIGGTATGLNGTVVLQNNGGGDLTISANGAFTFAGTVANGGAYAVGVSAQPAQQQCSVSNGAGVVGGANVVNVGVNCDAFLSVASTIPADNAAGIARDASITIQFSASVDPATITGTSITLASAVGAKALTFITSGSQVTAKPVGSLLPITRYTLTITPAVRGAAGQQLANAVTRTFRATDGQWGAPQLIQSSSMYGATPQIGFDAAGNAIAVWSQFDTPNTKITANRFAVDTGWEGDRFVQSDGIGAVAPQLAVGADGNAFVVWTDSIAAGAALAQASRYVVGTGWSPELLLGAANSVQYPQVAVDSQGDAIATWGEAVGSDLFGWSRRYAAGVGWESGIPLSAGTGSTSSDIPVPTIALDADGNAIAAFRQKAGIFHDGMARRYTVGAGWAAAESIESEQASVSEIRLTAGPGGVIFAVWAQGTANFGPSSIWSNRYVPGAGWGSAELLEHDDFAPGQVSSLAIDAAGNAIAVWQHSDLSRAATDIWANRYVPGTGWGAEQKIETQRLGNADHAHVAMDSSGNAIAVWQESDGTRPSIWTNRFVAGGGWGVAQKLENSDLYASDPQIAIDASGNAFAIWTQVDQSAAGRIYIARFE